MQKKLQVHTYVNEKKKEKSTAYTQMNNEELIEQKNSVKI